MDKTTRSGRSPRPASRPGKAPRVPPKRDEGAPPRRRGDRRIELEWRRTHSLKEYAGQWVVLERETIIAHGYDARQVVQEARSQGIEVPYLFRVDPHCDEPAVRIGL